MKPNREIVMPKHSLLVLTQWSTAGEPELAPYGRGIPQVLEARLASLNRRDLSQKSVLFQDGEGDGRPLMIDQPVAEATMARLTAELQPDYHLQGAIQRSKGKKGGLELEVSLLTAPADDKDAPVDLFSRQITTEGPSLLSDLGSILLNIADVLKLELSPEEAERLTDFTTKNPAAFFSYLTALTDHEDSKTRLAGLDQALKVDPGFEEAAVSVARLHLQEGNTEEAESILKSCLDHRPNSAKCHHVLGLLWESQGHLEQAKGAYTAMVGLLPTSDLAHFHLGSVALGEGKNAEAKDHLSRVVASRPDHHLAWENLAVAFSRLNELNEAATCLLKSHELQPDSVQTVTNLGKVFMARGDKEEGTKWFRKGLALDPSNPVLLASLGLSLADQEPDEAAGILIKAMEDHKGEKRAQLAMELASVHARSLAMEKAEAALIEAENNGTSKIRDEARSRLEEIRDPKRRRVLERRILTERFFIGDSEQDQASNAISHLTELSTRFPDRPEVFFCLGLAHRKCNALDFAVPAYRRTLEIDPNHVDALTELGVILGQMGQMDESLECAQRAIELEPDSAAMICNVGAAHLRRNETDEAAYYFSEAKALDPDDPIIQNCLEALKLRKGGEDIRLQ